MGSSGTLNDDGLPPTLTLLWIARFLRQDWSRTPREFRWHGFRSSLEVLLYGWWQQRRGRPFRLPLADGSSAAYRITKQIPGIEIGLFGRHFWLLVPAVLETVPIDPSELPRVPPQSCQRLRG